MSFFSSSEPEDLMGTPEERESYISDIISFLSVSTMGELVWVQRYLDRSFQSHTSDDTENANVYEQKKHEIANLLSQNQSMLAQISNIKQEKDSAQKHIEDLKKDLSNLSNEREKIQTERDNLADELQRIGKLYEEATGKQANQQELKGLLNMYITLLEDVFSGRAHFKVLSIMHGEKDVWSRSELVKSTGFSDIMLRTVLGVLARVQMIEYDEEQATAKLIKRISSL